MTVEEIQSNVKLELELLTEIRFLLTEIHLKIQEINSTIAG